MGTPLARDTAAEIERLQVESWRRMSSEEKAALVTAMSAVTLDLALAGVRQRHPAESPESHRLRLARILFGRELADRAYAHIKPGL